MRNDIHIREIQDSDYGRIADFHLTYPEDIPEDIIGSSDDWKKLLYFWWDQNPAFSKGYPRGVVALKNNKIIGFTANIPTRMLWSGKEIVVSNGVGWRVLPEYRRISMDISDKNRELTHGHVRFNTTANELVSKLLKIHKWSQYTCADDFYYYLGNSQGLYRSRIIRIIAILQKILVVPLNSLSMILPKQVLIRADANNTTFEEVDKLWSRHKDEFQFSNVRDSRYLNWLSKLNTKTIYYIYYKNEMKGFIILNTYLNRYKEKSVMLVDFWCPDIANYAKAILNFLLRNYKDYNLLIPSYNNRFRKAAMSRLLIKRKRPNLNSLNFIHFGKEKPIEYERSFLTMMQGNVALTSSQFV